jgi:hypothetical protein
MRNHTIFYPLQWKSLVLERAQQATITKTFPWHPQACMGFLCKYYKSIKIPWRISWDYNKSQMRTSVALTQTCYAVKVNFAFDLLPFQNNLQDLNPLSLIRYPNFKGLRKMLEDCFIEFWRSVGCSKYHHLCILYKNIINESGQARPMNKSHFHKSYMKCILASHCIERLHKCSTCFKSKNSRSVVNTSHNAMNSSFMPHDL